MKNKANNALLKISSKVTDGQRMVAVRIPRQLVFVLVLYVSFICYMASKGLTEAYMSVVFPTLALSTVLYVGCIALARDDMFAFSIVMLINIGTMMQVIINTLSPEKYIFTQCVAAVLGLVGAFVLIIYQNMFCAKKQYIIAIVMTIVIYVCLLLFGATVNGSKAWIRIGSFSFQPTEITKVIAVYLMAVSFANSQWSSRKKYWVAVLTIAINAVFLLVIKEMGSLFIIASVFLLFVFAFLDDIRYVFASIFGGATLAGVLISSGYVCNELIKREKGNRIISVGAALFGKLRSRWILLFHPESLDPYGNGYQYFTAKKAIELGGWFGSKYEVKIPVAYSDYVYASLILHMGYIMAVMVLLLFIMFFLRGIHAILKSKNIKLDMKYCSLGFLCMMVFQSMLTILGSTNCFLLMGLPIAFLSAGGSHQITQFLMLTYVVISISGKKDVLLKRIKKICGYKPRRSKICRIND